MNRHLNTDKWPPGMLFRGWNKLGAEVLETIDEMDAMRRNFRAMGHFELADQIRDRQAALQNAADYVNLKWRQETDQE